MVMVAITAHAQYYNELSQLEVRTQSSGTLLNRDIMSVADLGTFSMNTFTFGSARSMGLAGAMTSLGGDATSMLINPAGLGMARSNDFTLTPVVVIQRAETTGGEPFMEDGETNFTLSNFSTTINLYEDGNSKLISLNLGLGYNRVADLNYDYSFVSRGNSSSIANLFSRQLTGYGVPLNDLYGNDNPDWSYMPTNLWGAALGYKTGLTYQEYGEEPSGFNSGGEEITDYDSPIWSATWIAPDATVDQYMRLESSGSIGEYDIALGANIDNKLYIGATFGVQSLYQRLDLIYGEEYGNQGGVSGDNALNYTNYNQAIITRGGGVNFKVGATYRASRGIRVGVAYHSPTYYSLNREYQISMASSSTLTNSDGSTETRYASADSPILEDSGDNVWRYRTASKVMIGASYTFGMRGLISVDYERDWYGSMKMRSTPYGIDEAIYDEIENIYQGVNIIRVGAEYKITPALAIRGGYGASSQMVQESATSSMLLNTPTTNSLRYHSVGIGYSISKGFQLDLTYMSQTTKMSEYRLFYSDAAFSSVGDGAFDSEIPTATSAQSGVFKSSIAQHSIALSFVMRM